MDEGLTSDDHFSVDGALIQSYASLKSLKPIDGSGEDDDSGGRVPKNERVDFRGQTRRNATHRSTTDGEARLYRKGDGQPAMLCHSGHIVTENRHGLVMSVSVDEASGLAERAQDLREASVHEREVILVAVEPLGVGARAVVQPAVERVPVVVDRVPVWRGGDAERHTAVVELGHRLAGMTDQTGVHCSQSIMCAPECCRSRAPGGNGPVGARDSRFRPRPAESREGGFQRIPPERGLSCFAPSPG